ncbi:hypothetical protein ES705_23458 [subsurface metagenome]
MKKLSIKRSKRGFTLIELMVVVVIIAVLVVLGFRFYSGQVEKAKNTVTKANVSTIQFFVQAELIDDTVVEVNAYVTNASSVTSPNIYDDSGIHNPFTGEAQTANGVKGADGLPGDIYVTESDGIFYINGNDADGSDVFVNPLTARK